MQSALKIPQSSINENNLIKDIFVSHLNHFYSTNNNRERVPSFVKKEVSAFLECGVLAYGFVKLYCKSCKNIEVLAFSCKRRGFCPSCCARRMNDTAIHLDENVFPDKPVRQWVLSFPFFIRYLMAYDPQVVTALLRIHCKVITKWYEKKHIKYDKNKTGSVTVVQRFGGALNINPHFHSLFLDGCFYKKNNKLSFQKGSPPSQKDQEEILKIIIKKIIKWLVKKTYLEGEYIGGSLLENSISDLHGQSVVYRIAVGKRAGEKVELFGYEVEKGERNIGGGVSLKGFNIHAKVRVKEKQREKLKTLCRYIARGPLSKQRIEKINNSKLAIRFKRPWSSGATHVVYSNIEFIEKLVALVPPTRAHLTRYHGVFAPRSQWRKEIVPAPRIIDGVTQEKCYRLPWGELLKRTFGVNAELCKSCGYKLEAVSLLLNGILIKSILDRIGMNSEKIILKEVSKRGPPDFKQLMDSFNEYSQAPSDW